MTIAKSPGGMPLIEDPYCPRPEQVKWPKKGPYWKRRAKKMAKDPRNWSKPEIFVIDGKIVCHPEVAETLRGVYRCGLT